MSTKNKMSDLRDHLFAALEGLSDTEKPLEIERAQAICKVSQQIIETAKVEVKFLDTTGNMPGDNFWSRDADTTPAKRLTNGGGGDFPSERPLTKPSRAAALPKVNGHHQ